MLEPILKYKGELSKPKWTFPKHGHVPWSAMPIIIERLENAIIADLTTHLLHHSKENDE